MAGKNKITIKSNKEADPTMSYIMTNKKCRVRIILMSLQILLPLLAGAQYNKLLDFDGTTTGKFPQGSLYFDGAYLYGATAASAGDDGKIYKINLNGTGYTTLLDFNLAPDGRGPTGPLISDGTYLFGMTVFGGVNDLGTIYKIKPDGTGYAKLYDFGSGVEGRRPYGSLLFDGTTLYGMTAFGGTNNGGTIFKILPNGTGYLKLFDFDAPGVNVNGNSPDESLIYDGLYLYGMTTNGGTNNDGVIFKILTDGTGYLKLHEFDRLLSGESPYGSLYFDGLSLYGMTWYGGVNDQGVIFTIGTDGTGFNKLLDFDGVSNGRNPEGSLFSDGTFLFGMTTAGGTNDLGTLFKIKPDGTGYVTLVNFDGTTNGSTPREALISNGTILYGATEDGGANGFGTLFNYQIPSPSATPELELTISNNHLKEFPITSGYITSIVAGDTYSVLRGNFSGIGPYQGIGAVVSAITGVHDTAYPIIHSGAGDVVADGSGGWYVTGTSDINGVNFGSLLHIKPDKTIDANWLPKANNSVTHLALEGNTLYVAGAFTQIAGESRNRFAAFDVTTGAILPWDPGVSGNTINFLNKLTASGGMVYVGGQFTAIGGVARKNLAAINGTTGAVTAWNPTVDGINSSTSDIVVSGSLVYVSGFFTSAGGASRKSLAALDITTGLATSWNPNPTGIGFGGGSVVEAMLIDGSTMYIGGTFTAVGGTSREYLAAINIATGVLTSWDPNFDDSRVYALALIGNTLYVGGTFSTVNGLENKYLVAVSTVDGSLTSWNPDPKTFVIRMALSGSNLFVVSSGGNFQFDWPTANSFAVIDNSTAEVYLTDLDLGGGSITYAIASGNILYASGNFTLVNGQARQGLAAIDIPSNTLLSWAPSTDGQVNAIFSDGTAVYLGGNFSIVNGSARDGLAALDATGSLLAWNGSVDIDSEVKALYSVGGKLYMGGDFTSVNSSSRNRVASFDLSTGNLLSWNPTTGNFQDIVKIEANADWVVVKNFSDLVITVLSASSGSIVSEFSPVLGGLDPDFTLAYNQVILGPQLTAYDLYEDDYTAWIPDVGQTSDGDPAVGAVAFVTDKILVGGEFSQMGFERRENFGAYAATAPLDLITITIQPTNVVACEGETAIFSVTASGTTNITYQWQYSPDGTVPFEDIADEGGYSGATTSTLSITSGDFGEGRFRCKLDGDLSASAFTNHEGLVINPIPAPPTVTNVSMCGSSSFTLSVAGGVNGQYRWYANAIGGPDLAGEINDIYVTPVLSSTTSFYVSLNNGCESTRTQIIATVDSPLPKPTITSSITPSQGSVSVCSSNILTLMAPSGFDTYIWSNGETTRQIVVTSSGSYTVIVTNSSGCVSLSSDVLTVDVIPAPCANQSPVISTTKITTQVSGKVSIDLTLLISDADNNIDIASLKIISPPLSGALAEINNSILTIDYSGLPFSGQDKITIEVCDLLGSCAQQELVIDVEGDINIYTGISPNGDFFNEKWIIQNIESLPDTRENKVSIFNRWGDLIFETSNYDNDTRVFKGINKNGNEVTSGVYFYKIEFTNGRKMFTGYLTIKK